MGSVKILATAAAIAAAMSTAAFAADFPPALPMQPPPPPPSDSGWYLRGDVGVSVQKFDSFDHFQTNPSFNWPASWAIVQKSTDDSAFVDFGVGYQVNNWLRFDVTGEHRTSAKFKVVGSYSGASCNGGVGTCFDDYDGSHSAEVLMLNAYLDLGTWWCLTPFVGAGVGGALNNVTSASDIGLIADGSSAFGYASSDASNWNLAWSVTAGVDYSVSSNLKLEAAVRYLNMGNVKTAIINCSSTSCTGSPNSPSAYYTLNNFDSLDLKLGFRWLFQPEVPVYAPPLVRKG